MSERLTNEIVAGLEYKGKQYASCTWSACYVWDGVPGFGVRIYPTGVKTYVLKYRNEYGRQRYHKIGNADELSASKAREKAERARDRVREGLDPNEEKAVKRDTYTVKKLGEAYIERYAKVRKKRWDVDQDRLERHIYPRWGKKAAPEVARVDVDQMHRDIKTGTNRLRRDGSKAKGGPNEANRALALVSKLYNWAIKEGYVPIGTANPAKGIKKFPEKKRARWVQRHEMPWVLDALDEIDQPYIRTFFWLLLYTGARKSEAFSLQWRDVDFAGREITFRETKNGKDHTVPMSEPLAEMLRDLVRVEGNPYVFVGRNEGTHLVDVRHALCAVQIRAAELAAAAKPSIDIDISDVTFHDVPRTVGAWLAISGYSELLIGRVLNYQSNSVTAVYARLSDDAVRDAVEAHAGRLATARRSSVDNIVELRPGEARASVSSGVDN